MEESLVDSEIIHGGEGGDVERCLELRNKFFVFANACLLISISLLVLLLLLQSLFIACITFTIALHSSFTFVGLYLCQQEGNKAIKHLNSSSRGIKEEKL